MTDKKGASEGGGQQGEAVHWKKTKRKKSSCSQKELVAEIKAAAIY